MIMKRKIAYENIFFVLVILIIGAIGIVWYIKTAKETKRTY